MKKFLGYTVINTKTEKFVDSDGNEDEQSFQTLDSFLDVQTDVLDEIDYYVDNWNNKHSRKVKRNRKYFKIIPLYLVTK